MKFADKIREILTRVVIVDSDNYSEAGDKVADAYYKGNMRLHADNSAVEIELEDDTKTYAEMFGKDFENMQNTMSLE